VNLFDLNSDAPEFEFCIVTAKYLIECAAINPVLAEVSKEGKGREEKRRDDECRIDFFLVL
jgi:hypothetical protein